MSTVYILGTRGTVTTAARGSGKYGCCTTCVLVELEGRYIILDAGSGLMSLPSYLPPDVKQLDLLLTHPHADHLVGLPACPVLFDPSYQVTIHAAPRQGLGAKQQVAALMSPPLWPVGPEVFQAQVAFRDLSSAPLRLGPVTVDHMEGSHPGGCSVLRLRAGGISIVFATDYEITAESALPLQQFAQGCDLLLCDGQYSRQEYPACRGFGHSAWQDAVDLAERSGVGQLRVIHHAPARDGRTLDRWDRSLRHRRPNASFAREGEIIRL